MGKHNRNLTWYVKLADDTELKIKGVETPEAAMEKAKLDVAAIDNDPVSARPARVYKKAVFIHDQGEEPDVAPVSDDVPVE